MRKEKMYSLALRKRLNSQDHFWLHPDYELIECKIECDGRYWLADPFLYEKEGNAYLFYEAYDLIEQRGKIGYSQYLPDGSWTKPSIIINERFHLSFPFIFDYKGDVYIMPESCANYSIKTYRAISFPDKWEPSTIVHPDTYACDSIIINKDGDSYLLAGEMYHNVPNGHYASCWVKNRIYKLGDLTVMDEGNTVTEGDFGIRNAGQSFFENKTLYRVGQDCRDNRYGRGFSLYEISSLDPYKEEILWNKESSEIDNHINRNNKGKVIGVHTYNCSEHYEVIDYSQIIDLPKRIERCRHIRGFKLFIKRVFKRFFNKT